MKYWWLKKYQNLAVKMLPDLFADVQYFLVVPKNYIKIYLQIENMPVSMLQEEELCVLLYRISVTKNVKDNRLTQIIDQLLLVPDASLPISDYSLSEILEAISSLKKKKALVEKLDCSNVAACYSCLNVFYVDKIKKSNKKGYCLCPFCEHSTLYLDNDLIPMNYSFLFLSRLFYSISSLGCDFSKLQKIGKKGISICKVGDIVDSPKVSFSDDFKQYIFEFQDRKIYGEDESKIMKGFHDAFLTMEKMGIYEVALSFDWTGDKNLFELSYLLILTCISSLTNFFYLKKIFIVTNNSSFNKSLNFILRGLSKETRGMA